MIEAVVMAAGEGRRLLPLTDRWPKPVLPIDGRPVVATLLRDLAAAGCPRATVVVGHLAEQVRGLAGDGSAFGLEVVYAEQPVPEGSADAVRRAVAAGATPPFLVTAADTVFTRGDLGRFVAEARGAAGALAVRRHPPPGVKRAAVRVESGRVIRVPDDDPDNASAAPLWFLGPRLTPFLEQTPGPPYELAAAYQAAIDDGLEVLGIEIGTTRDLTNPLDLVEENFPYLRSK
ncbi:MAG: sugar phosphate nucleotidyltransferase [Actinomycetota bacterium]|nr:sugar phosphate nucleotidyltransferase [Actinomycetota bacterium]